MPIFVCARHFGYDLLDIFICSFYYPIHFGTVWHRIVMLDLELLTDLLHHFVVQMVALSEMILSRIPYRHIISFLMKQQITDRVTLAYDAASTHFVK